MQSRYRSQKHHGAATRRRSTLRGRRMEEAIKTALSKLKTVVVEETPKSIARIAIRKTGVFGISEGEHNITCKRKPFSKVSQLPDPGFPKCTVTEAATRR